MAETKVVILGGRGMLGTDLAMICEREGIRTRVLDLPEFDITDAGQLKEAVRSDEIVINCAAYTNVENAESETDSAFAVNAEAVGRLGEFAGAVGTKVLHISTDFVFDGRLDRPYVETDQPNAINAYGRSKLAGEELLAKSGCHFCMLRLEWTYGSGGKNFVTKLIEPAKSGKSLRVVDDQTGSPTATVEVADVMCKLLTMDGGLPEGIFNFAAAGFVSRYEMARFMFDKLRMEVDLSSCKSSDYPSAAQRPANSCMDCSKIETLLGEPIEPWQGPLERFLEQL